MSDVIEDTRSKNIFAGNFKYYNYNIVRSIAFDYILKAGN
jgi:hypothetical protein